MKQSIQPQQEERKGEQGKGTHCLTCRDTHWTFYQVETLEGSQEDALELCSSCTSLIELEPQETFEEHKILFAAGGTVTCSDCKGHGTVVSYPHLAHCFTCKGTGTTLLVVGPRDEDQALYDRLYAIERVEKGRGLSFSERQVLRDRVRESRPTRFEVTRIGVGS